MIGTAFVASAVDAMAATLIHLVWQGGAIALALGLMLRMLRGARAETRYAAAVAALVSIALGAVITMAWQWESAPAPAALTEPATVAPELLSAIVSRAPEALVGGGAAGEVVSWRRVLDESAPALVALWFAGVFVFSLRLSVGYARILELVRDAEDRVGEEWSRAMRAISARLPLGRGVRLLQSSRVEVPTVVGWLRPVILVPATALTGLDARQIETILAHELAHIRRHDYVVNLVQSALETLLFYHPGVWWISRQIRIERENCCDDLAIEICGDRLLYARALTELEELRALAQPSLAATGGSLLARIRRIVAGDATVHVHSGWLGSLAVLTLAAAVAVAAPITSHRDADAGAPPAGAFFWPADFGVAQIAVAIAGSSPIAAAQGEPRNSGSLRVEPEEGRAAAEYEYDYDYDFDAGDAEAIVQRAHEASHGSQTASYAYVAFGQQGETITVRSDEGEDDDEGRTASGLTVDDLVRLKNSGIDGAWVRRMRELGYDLSLGELAAMRAVGVTPEYVASLQAAGYADLDPEELQGMRAVGVSAEYIAELTELGVARLSAEDLIQLRALGVTPAYIAEMRKLFGDDLDAEDLAQLRAVGVTAEYAAGMLKAGHGGLDVETMVSLRAVGVTPEYVAALRGAGYADADIDEIVTARAVGVSTEYLDQMAQYGIRDLDLEEVSSLRAVGVTPAWIREMASAGFGDIDVEEMQQLRALGVTAAWVAELRAAGVSNLTAEDLIELRSAGIDAEFIRKLEATGTPRR